MNTHSTDVKGIFNEEGGEPDEASFGLEGIDFNFADGEVPVQVRHFLSVSCLHPKIRRP